MCRRRRTCGMYLKLKITKNYSDGRRQLRSRKMMHTFMAVFMFTMCPKIRNLRYVVAATCGLNSRGDFVVRSFSPLTLHTSFPPHPHCVVSDHSTSTFLLWSCSYFRGERLCSFHVALIAHLLANILSCAPSRRTPSQTLVYPLSCV